ncbi:MAG: exodeoxyribonuclease VII large subunit, partial [Candidatus Omnitrophota bacterium]
MPHEQLSLTVSELNHYIQQVINAGFPESIWVCGEIQGYNRSREKKHIFFDLCETDAENKNVIARIGLVIFSNRKILIEKMLKENGNPF